MKTNVTQHSNPHWRAPGGQFTTSDWDSNARMRSPSDRNPGGCLGRLLRKKCPGHIGVFAGLLVLSAPFVPAATINLDSGVTGTFMLGQSYNETRAADVTVLSPMNLQVTSMTLSGINGSGLAKAVIYDSLTQSLLASAQGTLTGGTITLPISATLVSGDEYRIGFYGLLSSGTEFQPSSFPYTESTGLLRINNSWDGPTDSFPTNPNIFVPEISLQVTQVPEPGCLVLLGIGLLGALNLRPGGTRRRSPNQATIPAER